jgi:phospholipid transport system transporter-binding protein
VADPILSLEGSTLRVSGSITFATVAGVLSRARPLLSRLPVVATVDLSGATRIDSAGVALLVEFCRMHGRGGGELRLEAVPDELHPLLELYRLEGVLGVQPSS